MTRRKQPKPRACLSKRKFKNFASDERFSREAFWMIHVGFEFFLLPSPARDSQMDFKRKNRFYWQPSVESRKKLNEVGNFRLSHFPPSGGVLARHSFTCGVHNAAQFDAIGARLGVSQFIKLIIQPGSTSSERSQSCCLSRRHSPYVRLLWWRILRTSGLSENNLLECKLGRKLSFRTLII